MVSDPKVKVVGRKGTEQEEVRTISSNDIFRPSHSIYGRSAIAATKSLLETLLKEQSPTGPVPSNQGVRVGLQEHPFDFSATDAFKNANVHHSTCIETKCSSTVGLGFVKDTTEETLDSLCVTSSQDLLLRTAEDYFQRGNGLIEVVREDPLNPSSPIAALHHMRARDAKIFLENSRFDFYWSIKSPSGPDRKFARYGDVASFRARQKVSNNDPVSEIIHIPASTAQNRLYGMPDWLPAVASIELVQCIHQDMYDFFLNRGVPEFLLFILGKDIGKDNVKTIENILKGSIGLGNAHKSGMLNLPDPNTKIELHKLAMENRSDGTHFATMNDALALEIVSAHRVPALLAGIQLPGKMAAANELPNAIMGFQLLVISRAQKAFSSVLAKTLGDAKINGGTKLDRKAFEFKKITDEFDLGQMDTAARMKTPLGSAEGQARDLSLGLKKEDLEDPKVRQAIASILSIAAMKLLARQAA